MVLDATGCPSCMWASTTLPRISSWRGVSMWLIVRGAQRPAGRLDDDLGLGVADDLLAVLFGDGIDDRHSVADLANRARDRDLLLGHAHAAELHRQAPQ